MLQAIREKAQGWIAYAIVGLISIPFALWGINQYFGNGGELNIVSINDRDINQREFRQAYADQRRNLQQLMGENYRPELINEDRLREQVLDSLIENELMITSAINRGYRVSDQQVAQVIQSEPSFLREGRFDRTLFEQYLRNQGESADGFAYRLKNIMIRNQMQSGITGSEFATQSTLNRLRQLREQKRRIEYVIVPTSQFANEEPSQSEIEAYYEANKARFMIPELVRVEYVELKLTDIAATISPDEATLKQRYDEQKSRFGTPEDRQMAHILITVDDKTNEEEAKTKAIALRQRILDGERFEDIAKSESQDPGSAELGGDLGFIGRGIMDPEFERAAYAMGLSDISEPVRSAFGYHLLKVNAVKPGSVKSYDTVREQLKGEVQREMAESQFFDQAERLANATYENPETLTVAAERLGLEIKQSGWFGNNGGDGIADNPRVTGAAFSEEVLNAKNNSEPLELTPEHYVVLRVLDHKPSQQQALDEVRSKIVSTLAQETATRRAREKGQEMARQLRDGAQLADLAQAANLEVIQPEPISIAGAALPPEMRRHVFQMAIPEDGKVSVGGIGLTNGDYAVMVFKERVDDAQTVSDPTVAESLKNAILQTRGQSSVGNMIDSLRAKAKIAINRENF